MSDNTPSSTSVLLNITVNDDEIPVRYYDDMECVEVDPGIHPALAGGAQLYIDNGWRPFRTQIEARQWWLVVNGEPVAFIHTAFHLDRDQHQLVLCDIEVREDRRGEGLTRAIVAAVEAQVGHTMYTTGHFTPLGAQALTWLPVLPWEHTTGVWFNDQNFVNDWARLVPRHPM